MDYKVQEVKSFSEQTYGKYNSHRTTFLVEGNPSLLSAFVKQPLTVGQIVLGEIKTVQKDGKTYTNFEFAKKSESNGADHEALERIQNTQVRHTIALENILAILKSKDSTYPKSTGPTAFDDQGGYPSIENPDDVPF